MKIFKKIMRILKKIIEILLMLMVPFCYGIGLYLLIPAIIEDPSYVPYYVGIIFLTPLTALILFYFYCLLGLPIPVFNRKPKPKTFSENLVIWLVIVIFVCGLGSALLWWGFCVAERLHGVLIAFAIIVTLIGGAALGALIWQITVCLKNKFILKYGIETEATFIDCDLKFSVHFGGDHSGTTVNKYNIKFRYTVGEEEITKKSQSIYTREEADYFKQINKFSVKYRGKSAVISQIPEQTKSDSSF